MFISTAAIQYPAGKRFMPAEMGNAVEPEARDGGPTDKEGVLADLLKGTPPAQLMAALREAMAGGAPMSPQIAGRAAEHFQSPRTSGTVAEYKEIAVSPKVLAQYTGAYELRPGFDLVIAMEGGQLVSQTTRQGKMPLFAEPDTSFSPTRQTPRSDSSRTARVP